MCLWARRTWLLHIESDVAIGAIKEPRPILDDTYGQQVLSPKVQQDFVEMATARGEASGAR